MLLDTHLYQIALTDAVFEVIVDDYGTIIQAADIAKWTEGKLLETAIEFWKRKKIYVRHEKLNDG